MGGQFHSEFNKAKKPANGESITYEVPLEQDWCPNMEPLGQQWRLPTELFDLVDDEDNVVGRRPGSECIKRGLLHRAIAILVFDEKNRVYIQKRADSMAWYPGHWTLSVMGHVSAGETYEQAAKRELVEELSIDCPLNYVAKTKTPYWAYKDMREREYLTVFEGRVTSPKIKLSEETKEGRFDEFDEFIGTAKRQPEKFTPDTLLALETYLGATRRQTKRG